MNFPFELRSDRYKLLDIRFHWNFKIQGIEGSGGIIPSDGSNNNKKWNLAGRDRQRLR